MITVTDRPAIERRDNEVGASRLKRRVEIIHNYWLDTLGDYPTAEEAAVIVMVLAAFDENRANT